MRSITVYDPPMCCPTGVCGPDVDPKLVRFASDLDRLAACGVEIARFNLAREPQRFAENPTVKAILERAGSEALPVILVGDRLVAQGRYPSREELAAALELSAPEAGAALSAQVEELVALGAAIAASCEPCFKYHYDKARKLGVGAEAMRAAVRIGEAVKAASTRNMLALADKLIGSGAPGAASGKGCCGASEPGEGKSSGCC